MGKKELYQAQASKGKLSEIHKLLCKYDEYLNHESGLALSTRRFYCDYIRFFLYFQSKTNIDQIKRLKPKDVIKFISSYAKTKGAKRAQKMGASLRSYFRFLTQTHKLNTNLADSIPKIATWRHPDLPATLTANEMQKLLLSCDMTCFSGLRDYAILMLLIHLGLRACEIVNLTLDDIDWNNNEIIIRGKGSTITRMPINSDLKQALTIYLQHRVNCSSRNIFIGTYRLQGFKSHCTVSKIVRLALTRAGLAPAQKGSNLLRHSFATLLLQQGATLQEIAMILRHKSIYTTAIYARVDFDKLRSIALPWPKSRKKGA